MREIRSDVFFEISGQSAAQFLDEVGDGVASAFAQHAAVDIDAAHAGIGGERNEVGFVFGHFAAAQAVLFFGQNDDRAAFGSFVGEAGKLRRVGEFFGGDAGERDEFDGLAIAQSDGAGLIEQQRVDVAGGFDGFAAHGQNVVLHDAVHAGDADGGEQAADGGGNEADQQRDQNGNGGHAADAAEAHGIERERMQGGDGQQEDEREAGDQNVESDFVGRFLALRAFDQRNHFVEKCFAGVGGDADLDLVGEDFGAAGNGAAVAAGFANDRSAFAGDDRFVNGGDAFDDFAVAGNEIAGFGDDDIAGAELGSGDQFHLAVAADALGHGIGFGFAQGIGLRFAAGFGHGFGEVGEQNGEPEPEGDLDLEADIGAVGEQIAKQEESGESRADFDDEHDRILEQRDRVQLDEGFPGGAADDFRVEERARAGQLGGQQRAWLSGSGRRNGDWFQGGRHDFSSKFQ